MKRTSVELMIRGLNLANVRYLVVGGLAVVAHGYVRYTGDVDFLLWLEETNLRKALDVLKGMGYRPRAPVAIEEFADAAKRQEWIEDKGLKGFSLFSSAHPETEVDLFIDDPLGFEAAEQRAMRYSFAEGLEMPVCGVDDLIKLKRAANRAKDKVDIEYLLKLYPEAK